MSLALRAKAIEAGSAVPQAVVLAVLLIVPAGIGAHHFTLRGTSACMALAIVSTLLGKATLGRLGLPDTPGFLRVAELALGVLLCSVGIYAITSAFELDAIHAFWIVAGVAIVGWATTSGTTSERRLCSTDLAATVLVLAGTVLWTRGALGALLVAEHSGVFPAWQDFFLHAAEITGLRNHASLGDTSPYLAGVPRPFYHRASYGLAAAYADLAGERSLAVALYVWLPAGIILSGLAAYATGCVIWSPVGGLAAATALMLVPDPSLLWPGNALLGYHWLVQVAPGSGYAIAAVLLGIAVMLCGARARSPWLLWMGLALVAMAALFRVHVALVALAALVPIGVATTAPRRRTLRLLIVGAFLLAGGAAILIFERIDLAPHFLSGRNDVVRFMDDIHLMRSAYGDRYRVWSSVLGEAPRVVLGVLLLIAGAFGTLMPALLAFTRRDPACRWAPWLPWILLAAYIGIVVTFPTPAHGDVADLKHRPFVLVYAIFAVWMGGSMAHVLAPEDHRGRVSVLVVAALLVVVPLHWGRNIQASATPEWGNAYVHLSLPRTLQESARLVRKHSPPSEAVLLSGEDPLAAFVALSERPAYLSRRDLFATLGGTVAAVAERRHRQNEDVLRSASTAALAHLGVSARVAWYVLESRHADAWPVETRASGIRLSEGDVVFRLSR